MSYFSSECIQRLITYRFKKQFNIFQKLYLYVYVVNYTLIIISSSLIHADRDSDAGQTRQWLNGVNFFIIFFADTLAALRDIY